MHLIYVVKLFVMSSFGMENEKDTQIEELKQCVMLLQKDIQRLKFDINMINGQFRNMIAQGCRFIPTDHIEKSYDGCWPQDQDNQDSDE